MLRMTFSGQTLDDVLAQIRAAASAASISMQAPIANALPTETTPPKVTRTRKPKETQAAPEAATIAAPAAVEVASIAPPVSAAPAAQALENIPKTKLSEALQKVAEKHGMPVVKTVLQKFGANRIGDLASEKYKDFLIECDRVLQ